MTTSDLGTKAGEATMELLKFMVSTAVGMAANAAIAAFFLLGGVVWAAIGYLWVSIVWGFCGGLFVYFVHRSYRTLIDSASTIGEYSITRIEHIEAKMAALNSFEGLFRDADEEWK